MIPIDVTTWRIRSATATVPSFRSASSGLDSDDCTFCSNIAMHMISVPATSPGPIQPIPA